MQNGRGNNGIAPQQLLMGLMFAGMFAYPVQAREANEQREKLARELRLSNFDQVKKDNQRYQGNESRGMAKRGR